MDIKDIIYVIILGVAALALAVYIIVMAIKNKWIGELMETVEIAISDAEKIFPEPGSGEEKKQYVLAKVEEKATELGIPWKILKSIVSALVDKIIADYNVIAK